MFKSSVVLASLVASSMATVFVTNPIATTTCAASQPCNVAWRDDGTAPSLADFGNSRVAVFAGNAQQQTLIQLITASTNVATTGSIVFNPDPSIGPNGDDYFIRFDSLAARDPLVPANPAQSFSSRFTLSGMTGQFNASVQAQVDGLSTAPLAGPTSTGARPTTTGTTTARTTGTTTGTSTKTSGTSTTTAGAANGASGIMISGTAAGFAAVAAAMLGLAL